LRPIARMLAAMVQAHRQSVTSTSPADGRRVGRSAGPATESKRAPTNEQTRERAAAPDVICPFLVSADLSWRAATASREHRCTAVVPAQALALDLQRELCLAEAHRVCDRFVAAARSRSIAPGTIRSVDPRRHRPIARTMPLLLERGRVHSPLPSVRLRGSIAQIGVFGLLGFSLAVILAARLVPSGPPAAPSSKPAASVEALVGAPASLAAPIAVASPSSEPSPSVSAPSVGPSLSPAATRTYRVRKGDTLLAIAARFGTTARAIMTANGITRPDALRIGQVLTVP